jgi:hypothetical protein
MPTNLEDLKAWLAKRNISIETFKQSGRYMANVEEYLWLTDL